MNDLNKEEYIIEDVDCLYDLETGHIYNINSSHATTSCIPAKAIVTYELETISSKMEK